MDPFSIDPRIAESSAALTDLDLCAARLQLDARFPWIVLVPRRPGLRELDELSVAERAALLDEVVRAGTAVRAIGAASGRGVEKLNVGALGNVVPQLHVHVVGRRTNDPAWPGPVWGAGTPLAYSEETLAIARAAALRELAP